MLEAAGLEEALLASADLRVEREQNMRLWQCVQTQLGDEGMGLKLAQGVSTAALGMVGFAAQACATLGEAMRLLVELYPLITEQGGVTLQEVGPTTVSLRSLTLPGSERWPPSMAEAIIATQVRLGQQWLAEPYALVAVHFQHPKPADTRLHEKLFPCPVYFGQPHNELVVRRDFLEVPLMRPEPALREYLTSMARMKLVGRAPSSSVVEDVRQVLDEVLKDSVAGVNIEQVARRLFTSGRSLQRHLQRQGYTFQELVDQVRYRQALELLRRPGVTVSQVSDTLGFSEPRAFRRALRRWMQQANGPRGPVLLPEGAAGG